MHKYRLCSLSLDVVIKPSGPILIKSPIEGTVDPAIPDMSFVRTHSPVANYPGTTVYLPGSSLKGVLRSYCEGIGRALGLQPEVCNPLKEEREGNRCREEREDSKEQYHKSCHICRLFGSTRLGGRMAIADAYPAEETIASSNTTSNRTGVGIDRLLGSSHSGALYDFEVVEQGAFLARIRVENFELWQVGLLALALRDLDEGRLRIGLGTSRGLGFVKAEVQKAEARYTGLLLNGNAADRRLRNRTAEFTLERGGSRLFYGVAELMGDKAQAYGMKAGEGIAIPLDAGRIRDEGVEVSVLLKSPQFLDDESLQSFFTECVERLRQEAEPPSATAPAGGENV